MVIYVDNLGTKTIDLSPHSYEPFDPNKINFPEVNYPDSYFPEKIEQEKYRPRFFGTNDYRKSSRKCIFPIWKNAKTSIFI